MSATVVQIYISPVGGEPLQPVPEAQLEAGRGIVGDRYYNDTGTFSDKLKDLPDKEITLIELEEIDRLNTQQGLSLAYGDIRRNLVTRGIRLNDLVDKEFMVGEIRMKGIRLCEPCATIADLFGHEVMKALVNRAGLRACILNDGTIKPGDSIYET